MKQRARIEIGTRVPSVSKPWETPTTRNWRGSLSAAVRANFEDASPTALMNEATRTDRWLWIGGLLVVLLTIAAHARGLQGQFLEWDDYGHITQNPAIRSLSPANLWVMFTQPAAKLYVPLTWLSFAIDYQVWGHNPFGYHLTNLLLHGANTVLVLRSQELRV